MILFEFFQTNFILSSNYIIEQNKTQTRAYSFELGRVSGKLIFIPYFPRVIQPLAKSVYFRQKQRRIPARGRASESAACKEALPPLLQLLQA